MGVEIERKFLVNGPFPREMSTYLKQGYLSKVPGRTVRIRISDSQAWITIKSVPQDFTRKEFEYLIPVEDAAEMLELCEDTVVEKYRWKVPYGNHTWEIDEFLGENAGLIVAEVELDSPDDFFEKPDWIGLEVSEDPRYHNSSLSKTPFKTWT